MPTTPTIIFYLAGCEARQILNKQFYYLLKVLEITSQEELISNKPI